MNNKNVGLSYIVYFEVSRTQDQFWNWEIVSEEKFVGLRKQLLNKSFQFIKVNDSIINKDCIKEIKVIAPIHQLNIIHREGLTII